MDEKCKFCSNMNDSNDGQRAPSVKTVSLAAIVEAVNVNVN